MKLNKKICKAALPSLLILPCFLATGCHDDIEWEGPESELIEKEGHTITSFSLATSHFNIPENVDSVRIALIGTEGGSTLCFGAGVEHSADRTHFRMCIPDSSELPDGKYILTLRDAGGRSIPGRLSAIFNDRLLSGISIILPTYMLDGEGTEENPYIIANDDDFSMFLINLADDKESYGAGLKFKQTADVTAPDQNSLIPGRGYWGAPFAGIYDGDGHKVKNLYYRGSGRESSDSGIGLFNQLLGTASVANLSISGAGISGVFKESGVLAGVVMGDVNISDVSVSGYIQDGTETGGVVGAVKSGSLFISGIDLEINVNGTQNIGGIVGYTAPDAALYISDVTSHHFSVSGSKNVGGVLGYSSGTFSASDISLDHKVSSEDSDIRIIEATSECVGGIVGAIDPGAGNHAFISCHVLCPVGGDEADYVGGLIGKTEQKSELLLNDCRMYSVADGRNNVGGLFGKADLPAGLNIIGEDFATRAAADDADAKVSGNENVGGFAGWWKGALNLDAKVKINLPVKGAKHTGGAFGYIASTTVDASRFLLGQSVSNAGSTMRLQGTNETGGFAGHVEKCTVTGDSKFDFSENGSAVKVPDASRFSPLFAGVVNGDKRTGGLIGYAKDSKLQALCSAANVTGSDAVGGVVGWCEEANKSYFIEDCSFKGEIHCPDASMVGGIAGYLYIEVTGLVHDCVNYGAIYGGENTGGIVGLICKEYPYGLKTSNERRFDLKWCVNTGYIYGERYVGGVVGRETNNGYNYIGNENDYLNTSAADILFTYCMNTGKVSGEGGHKDNTGIGGIIGFTDKWTGIMYCANHGDIDGIGRFHGVGGVVGSAGCSAAMGGVIDRFRNIDIKECMNTATVTSGNADSYVGGVVGYQEEGNKSDVNDCLNLGAVPCKQNHDSGGVVGCVDHLTNIYRSVNRGMVSHGNAIIGTHKAGSLFDHGSLYFLEGTGASWPSATKVSKDNFTKKESFKGLDFESKWEMTSDGPALRNCPWKSPG